MKVVTFGEIMLRLKSPAFERFFQSPALEATFGGGEANVAVSLANYGMDARFVTVLPDNAIGDACIRELRGFGVDTSGIVRKPGRMGVYYLETGAVQRPSKVIYDRAHSAIADAKPTDIDWEKALGGAEWFHITGITPAISESAAELSLAAVKAAKKLGLHVSCDLNYRKKPLEVRENRRSDYDGVGTVCGHRDRQRGGFSKIPAAEGRKPVRR